MGPKEKDDIGLSYLYGILGACYVGLKDDKKGLEFISRAITLDRSAISLLEQIHDKNFSKAFGYIGIKDPEALLDRVFKFDGACIKCGTCCRDVMLFHDQKLIESEDEYEEMCKEFPSYKRFIPARKAEGRIRFACDKLSPEGYCLDYENRPDACRIYPNYATPNLKKGCGYRMALNLDEEPEKGLSMKNINAVALHLFRLGLYEKCIDLFGNICGNKKTVS